jgi:tripartite-type tricarboxylate transporter receptor subunit TctC
MGAIGAATSAAPHTVEGEAESMESLMKMHRYISASLIGLAMLAATPATAQDYPSKPVRFISPFSAGGSYTTLSRLIGQKLSEKWKQEFIIDPRPGGGGLIGTEPAARAAPDGYTIVMFGNNQGILPNIHTKAPFNVQKDFDPVILVGTLPALVVVNPKLPVQSMADLVKLVKQNPGKFNYGSGGNGSATHLATEMLKHATGMDIVHIPYKVSVDATMDLIAGENQVEVLDILSARRYVEAGQIKPLSLTVNEKSPFFPNVPTIREAGVENYEYTEWYGIFVPAGTPPAIIAKLNAGIAEVLSEPDVKKRLTEVFGVKPVLSSPEDLRRFFDNEIKKNAEAVKLAKLKIE